jgi:hypothetical protein
MSTRREGEQNPFWKRVLIVMKVQMGQMTVTEAARALGLSRAYYYQLEEEMLRAALGAVTPEKPGPKPETIVSFRQLCVNRQRHPRKLLVAVEATARRMSDGKRSEGSPWRPCRPGSFRGLAQGKVRAREGPRTSLVPGGRAR